MLDLSVIIPIYNTPLSALERCFDSMLTLEGLCYEVLLIDDGSELSVGAFCKDYSEKHPTFQYYYKDNGGVSSARNLGLSHAKGRYITFVDADDELLGEAIRNHFPNKDAPDMVIFDMNLTQKNSDQLWSAFHLPGGLLSREQVLYQLITNSSISGPCAKLYKHQRIVDANLCFDTRFVAGEDWMFVCSFVTQADTFTYCPIPCYRYFREDASGQSRMIRFPDKMLRNQLDRYQRKQEIICSQYWDTYTPAQISSMAAIELIENLFNSASVLLLSKQYTPERKLLIRNAVADAGKLLCGSIPKKTKLKLWVLTGFPLALYLLSILRVIYLRFKK